MTYALQNACLNGCGYLTLPFVAYVSNLYRKSILRRFTNDAEGVQIQDWHTLQDRPIAKGLFRISLTAIVVLVCALPALFIKLRDLKSPIGIMFTNIVIPFAVFAFFLCGGIFDLSIQKLEKKVFN